MLIGLSLPVSILYILHKMGSSHSTAPTFSFTSVGHETSTKRALFDWSGNGNDCVSSTRFDILWGTTMLLLVAVILRQWYIDRRARKVIEEANRLFSDDLESQKTATSDMHR
ncbi:hypothetical protein F5146DRAFT_1070211 [Armillaria mellea]|nr:hypothetical protein F5146DRAFT_1070211 [Armillaria mellea]